MELEIGVRCGCGRTMTPDVSGPQRYRCGCGQRVQLTGVPAYSRTRCSLLRGERMCNGPKPADAAACEPCSVRIATLALADPEVAQQLGTERGATEYALARKAETERMLAAAAELVRVDRSPDAPKTGVVYYAELRPGIVKIGTTLNLPMRMSSLHIPPASVIAAEPGTYDVEKQRHRQFAHLRIGQREDFRVDDELRAHVEALATEHGNPYELARHLAEQARVLASRPSQS